MIIPIVKNVFLKQGNIDDTHLNPICADRGKNSVPTGIYPMSLGGHAAPEWRPDHAPDHESRRKTLGRHEWGMCVFAGKEKGVAESHVTPFSHSGRRNRT